jgi:ABC-type nitrate/sulfonate/bicarbonate transport system permease component
MTSGLERVSASLMGTQPPGLAASRRKRRVGRRRELSPAARRTLGTASVVVVLAMWQVAASARWINPLIISSPEDVIRAAHDLWTSGALGPALLSTGRLLGIGFGISLVIGLVLGVVLGWYVWIDAVADPFVSILYAAPRIALIPLIIVWFGVGDVAQIVIIISSAAFPMIINTSVALRTTDRELITMARSYRASNFTILRTVALPAAVPMVLAGVRQGVAMALIGVVVAEYFIGNSGVGGMIATSGQNAQTAQVYVGILIFAVAALVFTAILRYAERRFDDWRN